jgi:membrane-bound metal-dependent hydrolase YbcI (DUF457 family)
MDNVTHTLFALTLARTPLGRGGRGTTAALVLASNAPDIDIVATLGGSANYLTWHRGPTHGPLGIVGLGVLAAALVWLGRRVLDSMRPEPQRQPLGVTPETGDPPSGPRTWGPPSASAKASADRRSLGEGWSGGPNRLPSLTLRPGKPDLTNDVATSDGAPLTRDAPFATLIIISVIGVLLHILMDLPTSYGTRLLSPFSWRWYAMDLMPIIDVYLWMILAGGLLAGSWRPRARQRSAAIALALMAANYGIRVVAHQEALASAAQVYGPALPAPCDPSAAFGSLLDSWPHAGGSSCLVDTAAIPSFGSPFEWRIIAQLPDEYFEISGNDAERIANRWTPQVLAAARTRTAQVLLGFSRFPVAWEFARPSGGATVQFTDMRFAMGLANRPLQAGRSALFTVTVTVGPRNEILEERLGQ